jgi:hypothetical protein
LVRQSDDGMTGGTFFSREAALRFVRHETIATPALVLHTAPRPVLRLAGGGSRP